MRKGEGFIEYKESYSRVQEKNKYKGKIIREVGEKGL